MKKVFLVLAVVLLCVGCSKSDENEPLTDYPEMSDPNDVCTAMDDLDFMKYCYEKFDVNKDGKVSIHEANAVEEIYIYGVKSLNGIQYFPNLKRLWCTTSFLDVSKNKELKQLQLCKYNFNTQTYMGGALTRLDISQNDKLETLHCSNNKLEHLNISSKSVSRVVCDGNKLKELDTSKAVNLNSLVCSNNNLSSLDISENMCLWELECFNNPNLTTLWINPEWSDWANSDLCDIDRKVTTVKVKK